MNDCLPERTLVACGPVSQVEECSCGIFHVSIGALTLRLQAEAVVSLAQTLAEAARRLEARADEVSRGCLRGELPS